jgi:prepilin-type N-terminal cleavage/methylation domain-containing protein
MKINALHKQRLRHSAFTLVELLLVIAIIAVLASMAVGVMASAQRDAAESATRSRISMLETLFQAELENYEVRRSPVPLDVIGGLVNAVPDATWADSDFGGAAFLIHAKNMKRMIMADVIRAEMPDGTVPNVPRLVFPTTSLRDYLESPPFNLNLDALVPFAPKSVYRWTAREVNSAADNSENLYMILSRIDLDGTPAVDSLGSLAIGDTDGDGLQEIVDAWGEPIVFQFRQQVMIPETNRNSGVFQGVWTEDNSFTGLTTVANFPIQVSQVRVFFTSERLREIDGEEPDYVGPPINFF